MYNNDAENLGAPFHDRLYSVLAISLITLQKMWCSDKEEWCFYTKASMYLFLVTMFNIYNLEYETESSIYAVYAHMFESLYVTLSF